MATRNSKRPARSLCQDSPKFIVIKKPATKARQGINPLTKEPIPVEPRQRCDTLTVWNKCLVFYVGSSS